MINHIPFYSAGTTSKKELSDKIAKDIEAFKGEIQVIPPGVSGERDITITGKHAKKKEIVEATRKTTGPLRQSDFEIDPDWLVEKIRQVPEIEQLELHGLSVNVTRCRNIYIESTKTIIPFIVLSHFEPVQRSVGRKILEILEQLENVLIANINSIDEIDMLVARGYKRLPSARKHNYFKLKNR